MPNIMKFGGGATGSEVITVTTLSAYDSTSRTLTIPETTKYLIVLNYYDNGNCSRVATIDSKIAGIIRKIGDSITIPNGYRADSGNINSGSTTVNWVNSTTVTTSRPSNAGSVVILACE